MLRPPLTGILCRNGAVYGWKLPGSGFQYNIQADFCKSRKKQAAAVAEPGGVWYAEGEKYTAAGRKCEAVMGHFDHLNVAFFTKAAIYPGSVGTFRYRFQREGWTDGKGTLTVWVYENTSFELAHDVESQTFPWTEEGVEQVKAWLEEKLAERGTQPYFIPYPAPKAE